MISPLEVRLAAASTVQAFILLSGVKKTERSEIYPQTDVLVIFQVLFQRCHGAMDGNAVDPGGNHWHRTLILVHDLPSVVDHDKLRW